MRQVVVFSIQNESYCLFIDAINEIIRVPEITYIPEAPHFIEGLINIRGRIHAVVNMRKKLGEPFEGLGEYNKIILVKHSSLAVGLLVDDTNEILKVEEESIEMNPEKITGLDKKYVTGVFKTAKRDIYMLDVERVLAAAEEGMIKATV